jgi:two-component system, OmpR family, sensor histidine kinase MtrB
MPSGQGVSLRVIATWMMSLLLILALGAIALLTRISDRQESISMGLADAIEAVHHVEELQADLVAHARGSPRVPTTEPRADAAPVSAARLEQGLAKLGGGRSGQERELIAGAGVQLRRYLELHASAHAPGATPGAVREADLQRDATYAALERLVELDLHEALVARQLARRTERLADRGAVAVSALLVVLAVTPLVWLWRFALRPVLDLARAMERFSAGERSARAAEVGARETRYIARRFNEMAVALERERENQLTFLSSVAHDLRNPLNVLRMSAALGEHGKLSPERASRALAMVGRQVDTLDRMVGDLLDATRIEAGKLELRLEVQDARALARDVAETYRTTEQRVLEVALSAEPLPIHVDPTRIEQVLSNLISNAFKYSPGSDPVRIRVARDGDGAVFEVEDSGIGISAEELPHVFEPFRRGGAARHVAPGVGLGLSVARRIVQAHGGSIHVCSTPGQGTIFRAHIPLAAADRPAEPEAISVH